MKLRNLLITAGAIVVLFLAAGIAGALPNWQGQSPLAADAGVASGISYQGRLTSPGGVPLNGTYTMRFIVYDAASGGTAVWDSGNLNILVENGLFHVKLGVDQQTFDGQALWLSIIVDGETLSPRQELLPAPYALSLRPGADIVGEAIGPTDAVLAGYAPATGTALFADANGGAGLFGDSEASYGVWGSSNNSWGGYFTSADGYGIRVDTAGGDHYDYGAYITSNNGYAVYAQSESNQAVRGEAGDISGIQPPLGPVGVVGMGQSRGVSGGSNGGTGVYGASASNYGLYGTSSNHRGIYGNTGRSDSNYGLYTPDNIYSLNYHLAGAVMQVMQNNGSEPLTPGDVVVFSGINRSVTAVNGPVVQVSRTDVAGSTAVAGVVFSRFNIDAVDPALESPDGSLQEDLAAMEVTLGDSAAPGEYVLVVVQGPAQVKASALGGAGIQTGDLLSTSENAGVAAAASTAADEPVIPLPGTVFAKALEPLDGKQAMIYVYVTLQ